MFHTINDQPPTCKRCHSAMTWTVQYGWHCPDEQCRQQQFEAMARKLANGRARLGRPVPKAPHWGGDE